MDEYIEVPSEEDYDEDLTGSDISLLLGVIIVGCLVLGFVCFLLRKTFKNFHIKVGNKFELGVETKEDK